jgi:hypothetical protein
MAKDEWRTSYFNTHDNEADLLTKLLHAGEKRGDFRGFSSSTSTGAEEWLALCELCFSHPSVGVFFYAHV